ncbi:penicillin-binding transpeptidase domain-containing protein [Kocuria palustris]|uniref:penicillin-binding transpeptidase domain-containing protein n=1 Tax=Kocuria palustris TaxID=71999 RepID=UPI00242DB4D2|nr:penicillin-binding transpeptidase domain-containing protein [Kocuria palustris]
MSEMPVHRRSMGGPRPARGPAGLRLTACLVSTGLILAGCSGPGASNDRARDTAESLAQALHVGDVSGLPVAAADDQALDASSVEEDRAEALSGMGGISPAEVTVEGLSEESEDGSRTATLGWRWDLPATDEDWTYETSALLVPTGEQWAVQWERSVVEPSLEADEQLRLSTVPASRGDITGAGGAPIVTERPVHRVGLDRSQIPDDQEEDAARDLAAAVDIDADSYAQTVAAAGDEAFVEAITLRESDFRALDNEQMQRIPGLLVRDDEMPLPPTSQFARDILGSVGPADQGDIDASGGTLTAADQVGRGGLQEAHDDTLRGQGGVVVESVSLNADGTARPQTAETLVEHTPRDGEDLSVTLDPQLQLRAEEALSDVESPSAIVAIRPSSGEVLAAANGPDSEGYSTALLGQYAPGSTFKVAASLALLRDGATPDTRIDCPSRITVDGAEFSNAPTYPEGSLGEIPLRESVAQSCNTSFISQYEAVDQAQLADAAQALGVGQPLHLGVPAFEGSIPDDEPTTQHAAAMIGQGRTLVSPLVMAVMAASVAEGELVSPSLVNQESEPGDEGSTTPGPEQPLTQGEAEDLQDMTRAVVTDGHLGDLRALDPDTAMGKTGTAEYGTENPPKTHSWVIASHGDLAVAVFVEDGSYGSVTGTPLMEKMLEETPST